MTPVYLNPAPLSVSNSFPVVELNQDQHLRPAASQHHYEVATNISQSRWSDQTQIPSSSSSSASLLVVNDITHHHVHVHKLSSCKREGRVRGDYHDEGSGSAVRPWMPSKIRLMQKMMINSESPSCSEYDHNKPVKFMLKFEDQQHQNGDINTSSHRNNSVRVCADCNTTTTPLWRSGPRGPKSLCNACGIRQRKARRAMAAADVAVETPSISTKTKKSRTSHAGQCKKQCKPLNHNPNHHSPHQGQKNKLCNFKNLAMSLSKNSTFPRVFPRDVEEAAILLMELSCGFIHS